MAAIMLPTSFRVRVLSGWRDRIVIRGRAINPHNLMSCGCKKNHEQTERPAVTVTQVVSAAAAILLAKRVAPDVIAARLETCKRCEYIRHNSSGYLWCSICGCKVNGEKGLTNLASYEEGDGVTLKHGCHHPDRANGKGWPR